jgi:hypothetical protein
MTTPSRTVGLAVPLAAAVLAHALPHDVEPEARRALAIATWMVLSWLFEALHPMLVGFGGCFLFFATGATEFDRAFAGFATETPWFLYGALILVGAAVRTGLVRRVAGSVPAALGGSFVAAAVTLVLVALGLGFIIPSAAARAVIVVLLALALSRRLDDAARVSSQLALVAVASYAAAVLGADGGDAAPPLAWRLLVVLVVVGGASWFVKRRDETADEDETAEGGARIALLLGVAVAAWATTALHGLSPAIVGLTAGLIAVLPGVRPRGEEGEPRTDPMAVIIAGTALSVPLALQATKASAAVASGLHGGVESLGSAIPPSVAAFWGYVVAALFAPAPIGVEAVAPGALGAATAASSGVSLDWIAACAATTKFALYQSPALILGAAVGGFATRDILKFGLALAIAGAVVVWFLSMA